VSGASSSFDPQIAEGGAVSVVVRNCFEGLVYMDEEGSAVPGAADSWDVSSDGKTYTFHLRRGVKWRLTSTAKTELEKKLPEDFSPEVTAYDFEFALKRAADPATGAKDAYLLSNITGFEEIALGEADKNALGVKATDDYTLIITLNEPESGFLETLTQPLCMPCNEEFFEATGGRYGLLIKYMMSNGPFYLTRFDENSFRMAKNPDYTGLHEAKTDVIWLYSDVSDSKLRENLSDKTYSGAILSEYDADSLKIKKSYYVSVPDILRAIIFNTGKSDLANVNVRSAFAAATDPTEFCEEFGKKKADSLYPFSEGYSSIYESAYSEKNAAELMKKGMEELEKTDLSFTLICEPRFDGAVRRLLQSWQMILGIHVNVAVETLSGSELEERVRSGNYDMAVYPLRSEFFAPAAYFSQFSASDARSVCGIESEEYDETVTALRLSAGASSTSKILALEKLLCDSSAVIPLWTETTCLLCVEGVSDVHYLGGENRIYFYDAVSR